MRSRDARTPPLFPSSLSPRNMDEDELDPAFLDMPSYEGGNGLGELSGGFGNEDRKSVV